MGRQTVESEDWETWNLTIEKNIFWGLFMISALAVFPGLGLIFLRRSVQHSQQWSSIFSICTVWLYINAEFVPNPFQMFLLVAKQQSETPL